MKAQIIH